MKCPACGETIEKGAQECPECGEPIAPVPPKAEKTLRKIVAEEIERVLDARAKRREEERRARRRRKAEGTIFDVIGGDDAP